MAVVAGDITEISWNNPVVGSGRWSPKTGETATFNTGGFRTDDGSDNRDGSGRGIYKKNQQNWVVETVIAWDNNTTQELESASAIAASNVETTFTITHVSGAVYKGVGMVLGDVVGDAQSGTIDIKIGGGGVAIKIA